MSSNARMSIAFEVKRLTFRIHCWNRPTWPYIIANVDHNDEYDDEDDSDDDLDVISYCCKIGFFEKRLFSLCLSIGS